MGAKIRGIFRTCKMSNKNIFLMMAFCSYIPDNQPCFFVNEPI